MIKIIAVRSYIAIFIIYIYVTENIVYVYDLSLIYIAMLITFYAIFVYYTGTFI